MNLLNPPLTNILILNKLIDNGLNILEYFVIPLHAQKILRNNGFIQDFCSGR